MCKDSSTSVCRLILLEGAQQMYFVVFPQESLFRNAGNSVPFSVLVVEINCPLHIMKELSTPGKKLATESVLEEFLQTVHMLVVEMECIQIL